MSTRDDTPAKPRRRSRATRVIKWSLLALSLLLVVLVGLVGWVAGTRSGLAFAWSQIGPRLPQGIEVASVKGRLIGPLEVRGVKVETDSMTLSVDAVDLDWSARELLSRTLHVKNLAVRGVDYKVTQVAAAEAEPEAPGETFSLPDAIDLPVAVQIDQVTLDDISTTTAPGGEPFVVDSARLADARLDNEAWHIRSLTGSGPMFDVDADARVTPRGDYATALRVDATLRLPDLAPIKAKASVSGPLDALAIDADVDAPYNLGLKARLSDALSQPAVDATATLRDLKTRAIRADLPQIGANATLTAKGPIDDLAVTLDADVDSADYGRAALSAALRYRPAAVTVERLAVTSPDTPGRLDARGEIALVEANAMDFTVDWSKLQWPLAGAPAYRSGTGQVRLTGSPSDYRLAADLAWQVVGQTQGQLALNGSGSSEAFDLKTLKVSGGPGDIGGHATIRWAPALDASAHLEGSHINPGAIVADVPGDFDLVADVSAQQDGDRLTARVDTLTANGRLRGQPLRLDARAQYLGDHVNVDRLHLVSGATTADVAGRFGWTPQAALDGRWTIDSNDLSTLWPTLAGRLETRGTVKGSVAAPNVDADLDARGVAYDGYRVTRATLEAAVDWSGSTRSNVAFDASGIEAAGQPIRSVAARLRGRPADHTLSLNVDSDLVQADLALDGAFDQNAGRWAFTLERLRAAYDGLAPWQLAKPATGRVSANAQALDDACLTSGEARVCLRGRRDAQEVSARVDISDLAYAYAQPYLPDDLSVAGALSGRVDARLPANGPPRVDAQLTTSAGAVRMRQADGSEVQVLAMQPGALNLRMNAQGLAADADLPLADTGRIGAQLSVAPGAAPLTERRLDGQVDVDIASLGFVSELSPEIDEFLGSIKGNFDIRGSIAQPRLRGRVKLDAPRIVLVTPGVVLTDVQLAAIGRGDEIAVEAGAKSGGGTLSVNGAIALNDAGQDIDLHIAGERFLVVNIPDVSAYVSPDLDVAVTPSRIDVSGRVAVPEASITPRNLPESGVQTVSGDQVIVSDEPAGDKPLARALHADVQVELGDKVHIEGFGLSGDLAGQLRVVQQPGQATTGTGEIRIVDGAYRAYGQNLDIQTGRILFAGGPVSQPGLEIRAARYPAEDVTVGVQVRGSLRNPRLTLFSDPSMGQSEQLSWLLLGRPLNGANSQESSMVARAALALGMKRGNNVLEGVGKRLGFDEVGLGSGAGESSDQAAFTVGKYLSPKLYVSYGIGLFDPVSTLSMRYTLNSRWRLETQSSSLATGGDIIYSIDR